LGLRLRVNTRAEGSEEERVWVVPSIKTKGVLSQVLAQVFGANTMVSSVDPDFCVSDELVDPRQPVINRSLVTADDLVVNIECLSQKYL